MDPSLQNQIKNNVKSSISTINVKKSIQKKFFDATLQLYNSPNLPREDVQPFQNSTREIVELGLNDLESELVSVRGKNVNNADFMSDINALFDSFSNSFDDFDTEYKRIKYYTESGTNIPPVEYFVGHKIPSGKRTHNDLPKINSSATAFFSHSEKFSNKFSNYLEFLILSLNRRKY